jgi:hypothetical protein
MNRPAFTPQKRLDDFSAPRRRFVTWFIASASCIFVALTIARSLRQGRLSLPPTYDDVVYFNDALGRLQILYDSGILPCFKSLFLHPPHAPLATLVPFVGFAIFGIQDWAPAAVNVVWVALILFFARFLLRDAPTWAYVAVALTALAWPLSGYLVIECRPDIYAALLTVIGSTLMLEERFSQASMRQIIIVGAIFGAALVAKPSISPVTLFIYGASLATSLVADGGYAFEWKSLAHAARRVSLCIAVSLLVALPYFAFAWRDVFKYIHTVTAGSQKAIWAVPMSASGAAAYYLWGPAGQVMMGSWFWITTAVVSIDALLHLMTGRGIDRRKLGLFIVFLCAYAAVSIPSNKSGFLGVIVSVFFMTFYLMACGGIIAMLRRWEGFGRWIAVAFVVALLVTSAVTFAWPSWLVSNSHYESTRRNEIIRRVADYFESNSKAYAQETIFFPVITQYLNSDTLQFELKKRRLDNINVSAGALAYTLDDERAALKTADQVILFDEHDPDILGWLPGAKLYDQVRAFIVADPALESRLELPTFDGRFSISVFSRKHPLDPAPFDASHPAAD